jgi:hypothetical protein
MLKKHHGKCYACRFGDRNWSCIPMDITLNELEQAINYWRTLRPSTGEERALSPEVNGLASVYAMMIFNQARSMSLDAVESGPRQLIESWRKQQASA